MAAYNLNDLQSDLANLGHLIDTIADICLNDCLFVAPGDESKNRLPGMDRLNGLIYIARDRIEHLNKTVDGNFADIGSTTKDWPSEDVAE